MRTVFKYIAVLALIAAMCGAEYYGMRPCGAGFTAALIYCGMPAIIILPAYLAFSLVFDFSMSSLIYAVAVCVATLCAAFASLKAKKARRILFVSFLAAAQFTLPVMRQGANYLLLAVWGIFALGIFVASVAFLRPVIVRKLGYKFLETELCCGGLLLVCVALGLSRMSVRGFEPAYFFAAFFIPFAAAVGSVSGSVAVAMCFGAGMALSSMHIEPISLMAFTALISSIFVGTPRPIASLSASVAYVLIAELFSVPPSLVQIIYFAVGALAFSLIPDKVLARVKDTLFAPVTAMAARTLVNRAAAQTGKDLIGASRIFSDMKLAMEKVPESETGVGTLEKEVCAHCPTYGECSANPEFHAALEKMERASAEKGRASVSELPVILSSCVNLPELVGSASMSARTRHEQMLVTEAKSEGRKIVAQQLGLMSQVLERMGERVKRPAHFDSAKEKKIAEELTYLGAAVPEVIVTDDSVSVVVQSGDISEEKAEDAVCRIMHAQYALTRRSSDLLPGYDMLLFARKPRYDVAYSSAGLAKSGKSGDNHSFVRLGGDRFMMALCDGMGSGEEAEKASETAIELVESFFRAGLDSMSAVECVNRFLALNECERFSTLDITVVDLNSGDAEIIKLSSPATVIKSESGVRTVSGSSLPMGVLEDVNCGHAKVKLSAGDEIIMTTDGISDSLGAERLMAEAARASSDPEVVVKELLDRSVVAQGGVPKDDCTVICARLYEKKRR